MSETSEHVQRLAEWWRIRFETIKASSILDTGALAQEALDASGATARIEEQAEEIEALVKAGRHFQERAEKVEKRVEVLDAQVLFVKRKLDQAEKQAAQSEGDNRYHAAKWQEADTRAEQAEKRIEAVEKVLEEVAPWDEEDVYPGDWDDGDRGEWWGEQLSKVRATLSQAQQSDE